MSLAAVGGEILRLLGPHDGPGGAWQFREGKAGQGFIALSDRFVLELAEAGYAQVEVSVRDTGVRRDQRLRRTVMPGPLDGALDELLAAARWWAGRLTIFRLQPGREYRVLERFADYYGSVFEAGTVLRYRERNYLPYDGGNTLVFEPTRIYLQDGQPELADFDRYLAPI